MSVDKLAWDNPHLRDKTRRKLMRERVLELTLPPHNKNKNQIADAINRSTGFVYTLQRELVSEGKLDLTDKGYIKKRTLPRDQSLFEDLTKTEFGQFAAVKRWIQLMRQDKVKDFHYQVTNFYKVCKTLDVKPNAFLDDIELVQDMWVRFVEKFRNGESFYMVKQKNRTELKTGNAVPNHYLYSVRSFITRNGKQIPPSYLKIESNHTDNYSYVMLNDNERKVGINYMQEKFGEEIKNIFVLHHEFGPRSETLFSMKPTFVRQTTTIDGVSCEYYKVLIFEQKQNRRYQKLAITPEAREVIKTLEDGKLIHSHNDKKAGREMYNSCLRSLYQKLGRYDPRLQDNLDVGTEEWYYHNMPSHVIRHSCVHWLMRASGERADVVSSMFWDKPETLKVYAKNSLDAILQQGVCYFCNPPDEPDPNAIRYCSIRHALAYYNNGGRAKNEINTERSVHISNDSNAYV